MATVTTISIQIFLHVLEIIQNRLNFGNAQGQARCQRSSSMKYSQRLHGNTHRPTTMTLRLRARVNEITKAW